MGELFTVPDFPCNECGRMLHWDMADDLEGDETYVLMKGNGIGDELVICVQCYETRKRR